MTDQIQEVTIILFNLLDYYLIWPFLNKVKPRNFKIKRRNQNKI